MKPSSKSPPIGSECGDNPCMVALNNNAGAIIDPQLRLAIHYNGSARLRPMSIAPRQPGPARWAKLHTILNRLRLTETS